MEPEDSLQVSNRRRRLNACTTCRSRKVRCSGQQPCTNCVRRSTLCTFGLEDRKITVSESFLNELKRKAYDNEPAENRRPRRRRRQRVSDLIGDVPQAEAGQVQEGGAAEPVGRLAASASPSEGPAAQEQEAQIANPLDSGTSRFCIDDNGRRRFLGPSSTWAYTRQVIVEIEKYVDQRQNPPQVPLYVDGNAYEFDWSLGGDTPFTKRELPSIDHALYLMNTVKFHIAQLYHLFDEEVFTEGLYRYYDSAAPDIPNFNLWYIQYLLVIAFGKAFLVQKAPGEPPSGAIFFARAMKLLPDVQALYQDTLLSIEVLCGISLYLQCIDHRNSAYVYLGIALRIAMTQGLHREADLEGSTGPPRTRYRAIWWTLYILDRKFSSLMGAPISIQDADVTVTLPNSGLSMHRCEALAMHVKLSRIITSVLNSVYGPDGRLNRSFVKSVQEVLRSLAALAPELESQFGLSTPSADPVSRVAGTLNLAYHQCVILATRPLLVHILFDKLSNPSHNRPVADPIKALIKACFNAAEKSLRILSTLHSQDLLESFLPFDIDCTHSSAFVLLLIKAVRPFPDDTAYNMPQMDRVDHILNAMIQRGSVTAQYRQSESNTLQELLRLVENQSVQPDLPLVPDPRGPKEFLYRSSEHDSIGQDASAVDESFSHLADAIDGTGLSPSEMLEVARLLDLGVFSDGSTSMPEDLWTFGEDSIF